MSQLHSSVCISLVMWFLANPCSTMGWEENEVQESGETATGELSPDDVFEGMRLTSRAFRQAAAKIQPSLVTIESIGGVGAVQGKIGGIRNQGEGNSTGVMISPEGLVITSTFNFIQQPPVITVITSDGIRRLAKLLGRDDIRKICLLQIEGVENMPVPEFVDAKDVRVGQWAVTIGVGYGDTNPAISMGIISATNRVGGRAIQTDANISPANYGGPLIDIEGHMIGICVPLNPQSNAIGAGVEWYDSGIGFAIPLYGAEDWIARLENGERIYPAFLGIRYVPNRKGDGLLIEEVVKDTPAEKAGLERGDRIVQINEKRVDDVMMMKQVLNQFVAGQEVEIGYIPFDSKKMKTVTKTVKVTLGIPPLPPGELPPLEPPKIR